MALIFFSSGSGEQLAVVTGCLWGAAAEAAVTVIF
jgi:hypothetical protein